MNQPDVIRSDAPHEVNIPAGLSSATSTQPVKGFGQERQSGVQERRVQATEGGVQWAAFEDAVVMPAQQDWAVRPARVTHMGRAPETRVDFRGPLKALRAKNAEVRERLNRLMAPVQQVMK